MNKTNFAVLMSMVPVGITEIAFNNQEVAVSLRPDGTIDTIEFCYDENTICYFNKSGEFLAAEIYDGPHFIKKTSYISEVIESMPDAKTNTVEFFLL